MWLRGNCFYTLPVM